MVEIEPSVARWSHEPGDRAGRPLLVLLHGVGSHEGDLAGLAPYLPQDYALVSLRAPLPHGGGFSWYPLDVPGRPDVVGVDDAAAAVLRFVDGLGDDHTSVGLVGFSQGGSLALQLLRHAPERFSSAVVLAGFVAGDEHEGDAEIAAVRPAVFYGRGDVDTVIPVDAVERTERWLAGHADAEVAVYPGLAHGISAEELDAVNAFLARTAAVAAAAAGDAEVEDVDDEVRA